MQVSTLTFSRDSRMTDFITVGGVGETTAGVDDAATATTAARITVTSTARRVDASTTGSATGGSATGTSCATATTTTTTIPRGTGPATGQASSATNCFWVRPPQTYFISCALTTRTIDRTTPLPLLRHLRHLQHHHSLLSRLCPTSRFRRHTSRTSHLRAEITRPSHNPCLRHLRSPPLSVARPALTRSTRT